MKLFFKILFLLVFADFISKDNAISQTLMNTRHIWRDAKSFSGIEKLKERKKRLLQDILKYDADDSRENDFKIINKIVDKANEENMGDSPFKSLVTDVLTPNSKKQVDNATTPKIDEKETPTVQENIDNIDNQTNSNSDLPYIILKNMKNTTVCDNIHCEILKTEASTMNDDPQFNISTIAKDKLVQLLQKKQVYLISDPVGTDDTEDKEENENKEEVKKKKVKEKRKTKNSDSINNKNKKREGAVNDDDDEDNDDSEEKEKNQKSKHTKRNREKKTNKKSESIEDDNEDDEEDSAEEIKKEQKRKQKTNKRKTHTREIRHHRTEIDDDEDKSSEDNTKKEKNKRRFYRVKHRNRYDKQYDDDSTEEKDSEENSKEELKTKTKLNKYRFWVTDDSTDDKKVSGKGRTNEYRFWLMNNSTYEQPNDKKESKTDLDEENFFKFLKQQNLLNKYRIWMTDASTDEKPKDTVDTKPPKIDLEKIDFFRFLENKNLLNKYRIWLTDDSADEKTRDKVNTKQLKIDSEPEDFFKFLENRNLLNKYRNWMTDRSKTEETITKKAYSPDYDQILEFLSEQNFTQPWDSYYHIPNLKIPPPWKSSYGAYDDQRQRVTSEDNGPINERIPWKGPPIEKFLIRKPEMPKHQRYYTTYDNNQKWSPTAPPASNNQNNQGSWVYTPVTAKANYPWSSTSTPPDVSYQWGLNSTPPPRQYYSSSPNFDNQKPNNNNQWGVTASPLNNNNYHWSYVPTNQQMNGTPAHQNIDLKWSTPNQQSMISFTPSPQNNQRMMVAWKDNEHHHEWSYPHQQNPTTFPPHNQKWNQQSTRAFQDNQPLMVSVDNGPNLRPNQPLIVSDNKWSYPHQQSPTTFPPQNQKWNQQSTPAFQDNQPLVSVNNGPGTTFTPNLRPNQPLIVSVDGNNHPNQQATTTYTPAFQNQPFIVSVDRQPNQQGTHNNQPYPANIYDKLRPTTSAPQDNHQPINSNSPPSETNNQNGPVVSIGNRGKPQWYNHKSPAVVNNNQIHPTVTQSHNKQEHVVAITKKPKFYNAPSRNDSQGNHTSGESDRNININIHIHNDKKDDPQSFTPSTIVTTPTATPHNVKINLLKDPYIQKQNEDSLIHFYSGASMLPPELTSPELTTKKYQTLKDKLQSYREKDAPKQTNELYNPYKIINQSTLSTTLAENTRRNHSKKNKKPTNPSNTKFYEQPTQNTNKPNKSGNLQDVTTPVVITERTPQPSEDDFNPEDWQNLNDMKKYFYGDSDEPEINNWQENLVTPFAAYKEPPFHYYRKKPHKKKESEAKRFSNKLKQFLEYLTHKKDKLNGTNTETTKKLEKNIKELYEVLNNIENDNIIKKQTENTSKTEKDDKLDRIDKLLEQLPNILNSSMALLKKLSEKVGQIDEPVRINVERKNSISQEIRKVKIKKSDYANITKTNPQIDYQYNKPIPQLMWNQNMYPRGYDPRMAAFMPFYHQKLFPVMFNQHLHRNPRFVSFSNPFGGMSHLANIQNYKQPKEGIMRYNPTVNLDDFKAHEKENQNGPLLLKPVTESDKPNTHMYPKVPRNVIPLHFQYQQPMQQNHEQEVNFFGHQVFQRPVSLDQPIFPRRNNYQSNPYMQQFNNFNQRYQQDEQQFYQNNQHPNYNQQYHYPNINPQNIQGSILQRTQEVNNNQNKPNHPEYHPQSVGPNYFNDQPPQIQRYRESRRPDLNNPEKYLNSFVTEQSPYSGRPDVYDRSERGSEEPLPDVVEENLKKIKKFLQERENQEITPELLEQLNNNPYIEILPCNKTSNVPEEVIKGGMDTEPEKQQYQ